MPQKKQKTETVTLIDDAYKTRTIVDDGNELVIKWGQVDVTFDSAYIDVLCEKYALRRCEPIGQKEAK